MRIQLCEHFDYKKLLRFVFPSIAMMVFGSVYGIVDGLFVSMDFADELYDSYVKANKIKDAKEPEISELKIYVNDINNVATVQEQIEAMGYYCDSMESARQSMQGQLGSLEAMLGGLAAISLFVAAIGITHTMIMSI